MSPTRRDTLKVAGAAGALAMMGGHVAADRHNQEPDTDEMQDAPGEGEAAVSLGHFASGAPAITIRLDDETIAENVSYGDVTGYETVDAGDHTLEIIEADEDTADTDTPATGDTDDDGLGMDNETDDNGLGVDNETDDNGLGVDNETDDNESDDNDSIISIDEEDLDLQLTDDNETNGNATDDDDDGAIGPDTADDNETDDDGLGVTDDNETDDNVTDDDDDLTDDSTDTDEVDGDVLYEQEISLGETYYTVATVGNAEETGAQAMVLQDYDAAEVRFANFSDAASGFDVTVEGLNLGLFDSVRYGQATDYTTVPPGEHTLEIREAAVDNAGDVLDTVDVEFTSGNAYSAYAIGSVEDIGGTVAGPSIMTDDDQDLNDTDDGIGADDDGLNDTDDNGLNDTDDEDTFGVDNNVTEDNQTDDDDDGILGGDNDTDNESDDGILGDDNETDDEPGVGIDNETDDEADDDGLDTETTDVEEGEFAVVTTLDGVHALQDGEADPTETPGIGDDAADNDTVSPGADDGLDDNETAGDDNVSTTPGDDDDAGVGTTPDDDSASEPVDSPGGVGDDGADNETVGGDTDEEDEDDGLLAF